MPQTPYAHSDAYSTASLLLSQQGRRAESRFRNVEGVAFSVSIQSRFYDAKPLLKFLFAQSDVLRRDSMPLSLSSKVCLSYGGW